MGLLNFDYIEKEVDEILEVFEDFEKSQELKELKELIEIGYKINQDESYIASDNKKLIVCFDKDCEEWEELIIMEFIINYNEIEFADIYTNL